MTKILKLNNQKLKEKKLNVSIADTYYEHIENALNSLKQKNPFINKQKQ